MMYLPQVGDNNNRQ